MCKGLNLDQIRECLNILKTNLEDEDKNSFLIEFTADRLDMLSVEGLSRAIKYFLGIEKGIRKYFASDSKIKIKAEKVSSRPYIAAALIRKLKINERILKNLINYQETLHSTLGRGREKVAIGFHDFDNIEGEIMYLETLPDAKMVPLDYKKEMKLKEVLEKTEKGKEYKNLINKFKRFPVYVDEKGIFSFPPIINSERTKVNLKTRNLLVEVTGIEKEAVENCLILILTSLAERNVEIEKVEIEYEDRKEIYPKFENKVFEIDLSYIKKILDIDLNEKDLINLLSRMGYDVLIERNIKVIVPCYRIDILHKIDIVEDVAIAYGYNNFLPEIPKTMTIGKIDEKEALKEKIRKFIVGFGLFEIHSPTLSSKEDQKIFSNNIIEILNPVSKEFDCLRASLIPSLLKFLSYNKRHEYPQNIFEIGHVLNFKDGLENNCEENESLCIAFCHPNSNYSEPKGVLEKLLRFMNIDFNLKESFNKGFIIGRQAEILIKGEKVGILGEIHPSILEKYGIEMPCSIIEILISKII